MGQVVASRAAWGTELLPVIIKSGLKVIFPNELIFHFIRYTIVTFVGIGVYPAIFKKLKI